MSSCATPCWPCTQLLTGPRIASSELRKLSRLGVSGISPETCCPCGVTRKTLSGEFAARAAAVVLGSAASFGARFAAGVDVDDGLTVGARAAVASAAVVVGAVGIAALAGASAIGFGAGGIGAGV